MPTATATSLPFSPAELSYLHTSLSSTPPIRPDGRNSTDFRPLSAETGILPNTNGSAHVAFSDGSEAIVGVKLEVEKTAQRPDTSISGTGVGTIADEMDLDNTAESLHGDPSWISLTLSVPSYRDDDSNLVYLEEMLREPLLLSSSPLLSKLPINKSYHWHLSLDVLLISSQGLASYPLPLLSIACHLALRDTRVPKLKSEGEEDPIADDDWMASTYLFPRSSSQDSGGNEAKQTKHPPVTLLVVTVGDNILFDPSHEELKVAESVIAISVASSSSSSSPTNSPNPQTEILSIRTIDTPARDTMKGIPRSAAVSDSSATLSETKSEVAGVWRPKVGGVKRSVFKDVVRAVLGVGKVAGEVQQGVAEEVLSGLNEFVRVESGAGS